MAALTDYLENALLNEVLRGVNYVPPTTVYLALFTSATTDAGGGTEVTGGSYARQAVTFDAPGAVGTAGAGVTANSGTITYTNMPTAVVTHCAIFDAVTAGNMLLHGALTASKNVSAGDTLTFAAGDLDITFA